MKKILLSLVALTGLAFAASAVAQSGGGDIVFENAAVGNITFSHDFHTGKGLACTDCHTDPFTMSKGADKITMADINAGKFCGKCHKDGGKAFAPTDCTKCHKK